MSGRDLNAVLSAFDEKMALCRANDPTTFAKIINRVHRNIRRASGRRAADGHVAAVLRRLDDAEKRLAARGAGPDQTTTNGGLTP